MKQHAFLSLNIASCDIFARASVEITLDLCHVLRLSYFFGLPFQKANAHNGR